MKYNNFLNIKNIFISLLFLFSLLINQYYGNKGIFPVDSFAHFDTGYRILLGANPFKDYWVVSGPIIDYFQAIFFYFFGVNWQSYVLHASLFNAILSISTFFLFRSFKLNIYYSFFYSILFSILAYPSSGTPFVDHHSAFFSLMGVYSLILGIKTEKRLFWFWIPIFFILGFLSKQVPSSYIIFSSIIILFLYSLINKKYYWLKYSISSLIIFLLLILIFGKIQGINISSFLNQYIFYPQSIGEQRLENLVFTFSGTLGHFKFIYLGMISLIIINFKNIFFIKNYYKNKNFYYFLSLFLLTVSLIFHQLLTKNQTFIFFLIPILFAFSHIFLNFYNPKFNKGIHLILISICLFAAIKYHLRFNENRKFHELQYVKFQISTNASLIDKKLSGLKWITPDFKNNANEEINLINKTKIYLEKDERNKMVITNYSFFSIILKENLYSPSRWHISDGTDYPLKGNKYFNEYKNLFLRILKNNDISIIYTIYPQESSIIYTYIDNSCFIEKKISPWLTSYELKDCNEFNS